MVAPMEEVVQSVRPVGAGPGVEKESMQGILHQRPDDQTAKHVPRNGCRLHNKEYRDGDKCLDRKRPAVVGWKNNIHLVHVLCTDKSVANFLTILITGMLIKL